MLPSINALADRLKDEKTFVRVRAKAAMGLCLAAAAEDRADARQFEKDQVLAARGQPPQAASRPRSNALDTVIRFYKESFFDTVFGRPLPVVASRLEGAILSQAIVRALATPWADGRTPHEAFDVILSVIEYHEESGAVPFDQSVREDSVPPG